MHLGDGLEIEVVGGAVLGVVHEFHDVSDDGDVVRIGLEARGEDGDEVFAGSDLAVREDALDGGLGLEVVLCFGVALGGGAGDSLGDGVVHVDHFISRKFVLAEEVNGGLEVVHQDTALRGTAQFGDDRGEVVVQVLGILTAEVDHVLALVVQDGGLLVHTLRGARIVLQTLVLQGEQGVHEGVEVSGVLAVLVDFPVDEGGTVHEQVLRGGSRADGIGLSPVGKGGIVILLLVILLIIGEVLDALCTVSTILSLG